MTGDKLQAGCVCGAECGRMRHDWVFEVLADLADYADKNGLPRLAQIAEEALQVARDEIRPGSGGDDDPGPDENPQVH